MLNVQKNVSHVDIMKHKVPRIHVTYDYDSLTTPEGNRHLSPANLSRIERSMNDKIILTVLIVNGNMEIIDGQHRFYVLKKMKQPIYFIIIHGLGIDDVKLVNTAGKGWNEMDHLISCAELGNEEYTKILSFIEKHSDLPTVSIKWLLSRSTKLSHDFNYNWKEGFFIAESWEKSEKDAQQIAQFKDRYSKYKTQAFLKAILTMIWNYEFDFDRLLDIVYRNSSEIVMSNKDLQIRQRLTEFYNHGLGKKSRRYFWEKEEIK